MVQPGQSDLLGRLAVHYQLISLPQLNAATAQQARNPDRKLGQILVDLGFINEAQLAQLLEAQRQYLARQAAQAGPPSPPGGAPPTPPRPPPARVPDPPATSRKPAAPTPPPASAGKRPALTPDPTRLKWLHKVLARACDMHASDALLHANAPVKVRIHGALVDLVKEPLHARDAEAVLLPLLKDFQQEAFFDQGQVDFSYEVPRLGRFRANLYKEHSGCCAVFHYIPAEPPSLVELGLPSTVARLINNHNGIVLITGPAGSGKTSTLAALVKLINEERNDHILSIEDPIEYVHRSKNCLVNQRQVNRDTHSFANALRSSLREDPDVICIGELRDLETISLAMSAAETGHLVLGTLHTQGAVRTVNRLIGAFPAAQQAQVRAMLAESLRAIISQKLLPRADRSGVALAYELLFVNHATANLIRENRTFQLSSVLQTGRAQGMRSLDDSIAELLAKGVIDRQTALTNAEDPRNFQGT